MTFVFGSFIPQGLLEEKDIGGLFFSTVAKSFYGQCAPSGSVHLGLTSIATNWMEKRY